jgi:hypothetical protein
MKNNKKIWIIIVIILIILVFIGISFAFIKVIKTQESINTASTLCLNITFDEDEDTAIELNGAESMTDIEGQALTPYTFKITNNCSDSVDYAINLDILTDLTDSTSLKLPYIKMSLNGETAKLLSEYERTTSNVDDAYSSRNIYKGTLNANESINYELRLWIDEDAPALLAANKSFSGNIVVISGDENELQVDKTLANYITLLAEDDVTNLAYDETEDNNIRYIGKDPNNYLCLDSECNSGKWRVIGLMNNMQTESNGTQNLVKIIRADNVGIYVWDDANNEDYASSDSSNTFGYNNWTTASLNTLLNSGDLYETYIKPYDSLFESVIWNLGGASVYVSTSEYYTYERGTTVYSGHATEWTGKIALMYPSDYGFATGGGEIEDRGTCLNEQLVGWYIVSDCYTNNYLYNSSHYQWTLMPVSSNSTGNFYISGNGKVDVALSNGAVLINPAGYLVSSATILKGSGTSDDPWIVTIGKDAN